jgi:hypothetical protein
LGHLANGGSAGICWQRAITISKKINLDFIKTINLSRIPDQSISDQPQTETYEPPGKITAMELLVKMMQANIMNYYSYLSNVAYQNNCNISAKQLHGWWFNPRTGVATDIGIVEK